VVVKRGKRIISRVLVASVLLAGLPLYFESASLGTGNFLPKAYAKEYTVLLASSYGYTFGIAHNTESLLYGNDPSCAITINIIEIESPLSIPIGVENLTINGNISNYGNLVFAKDTSLSGFDGTTILLNSNFINNGITTIESNAILQIKGITSITGGSVTNIGTLEVTGGTTTLTGANVTNTGGNMIIDNGGTLQTKGVTITGGSVTNNGTLEVTGGTTTLTGANVTNTGGSMIIDNGGTLQTKGVTIAGGSVTNKGTLAVTGGTTTLTGANVTNTGGNMIIDNGSTLQTQGATITGGSVTNNGTLAVNGGTTTLVGVDLTNNNQIKVDGGTLTLSGSTLTNAGTIDASSGTIIGTITNSGSGALNVSGGNFLLYSGTTAGQTLTISKLTGNANFVINTDVAHNLSDKITIQGSNSIGTNTIKVNYDPSFSTGQFVTGSANFATTQSSGVTFTVLATESGAYQFLPVVVSDGYNWYITGFAVNGAIGASETVYSGLDSTSGTLSLWRAENNNLTRRLGELRSSQGKAGEWVRVYRGEQKVDGLNSRQVTQQYTAIQGGYDTKHEGKVGAWFTGYAVGYLHADNTLERGTGTGSSVTVGAYASWLGDKGHYLDLIAKQGRLSNSYDSYLNNASATKVSSDYRNWGTSLSAEYGYRKKLQNGWYLEPQAEINLARLSAANYTTSDNTSVHNDRVNSVAGRFGLAIGRDQKKNSYYFKTSLAREFNANPSVSMASGGSSPVTLEQSQKDTWLEFDLGWTSAYDHNVNSYVEVSKTTGGKVNTPWQINVGIRKSFN
jgi:outer membrane autotransporter protein